MSINPSPTMSEFSLIHTHFKHLTAPHQHTVLGIGDDCAISNIPSNSQLVSCVDTLVAGRHFVHETSPHAIAYKSVAVNLSDLASMGATPYAILVGLSLPKSMANDDFCQAFAGGLAAACTPFGVELIGGDTTSSPILTISVTALGFVPHGQAITRQGACVGDVVCVSGTVGLASLALHGILDDLHGDGHANRPPKSLPEKLRQAMQYPAPQVALGRQLIGFANSMIDISDGLGQDLGHILTASNVGAVIELDAIPSDALLDALPHAQKWQHQINGGDDYQLCLTMTKANFKQFNQSYPNSIFAIGEIVAHQGLTLMNHHQKVDLTVQGWEHF
ncbi:thiamine-monophosphate kinase [Moraxella catarrhalis]|nr:thiamine-monophosphate kinase [Moraxella catarrhalis]